MVRLVLALVLMSIASTRVGAAAFLPLATDSVVPSAADTAAGIDDEPPFMADTAIADYHHLEAAADTAALMQSALSKKEMRRMARQQGRFVPDPKRALWLALVLPGGGQIYNRKYWKLPIVYGGFVGCTYAFLWNQRMYMDYSQAYIDIMDDDPTTQSYRNMISPNYDVDANLTTLQTSLKKRKDYYRRYRDMSAFVFIGIYILSVVDAYVDAELSVFDISRDLSLSVGPAVINNNLYNLTPSAGMALGVGCSLHF